MRCPICGEYSAVNLLEIDCGNLDASVLYRTVHVNACEGCGHVYNRVSPEELSNLKRYYDEEYAPANLGMGDKTGDRPGSSSKNSVERYARLFDLISPYIGEDIRVLDVGCAMGGFLDFLHSEGLRHLTGIDPTPKYAEHAGKDGKYVIRMGGAESIPFQDGSFDLMIMDQVLEHLGEPGLAFQEAHRVLPEGGLLCVGVPDASRYDEMYYFDFFWFLMREHLQHFDFEHLVILAELYGFELVSSRKSEMPIMSEKMVLPNLNVIFRATKNKTKLNTNFRLKGQIEKYVEHEHSRLYKKKKLIGGWVNSGMPLYAWGIGREFLYLYASAGLNQCNIKGLVDANPYKQQHCVLDGREILNPAVLRGATSDSSILVTALAHGDAICSELRRLNFGGGILNLSEDE